MMPFILRLVVVTASAAVNSMKMREIDSIVQFTQYPFWTVVDRDINRIGSSKCLFYRLRQHAMNDCGI